MPIEIEGLFNQVNILYTDNCPVIITTGSVSYNNDISNSIVLFTFRNLSDKIINNINITFDCFDSMGNASEEGLRYTYNGLNLQSGCFAGERVAILLKNPQTALIKINSLTVFFIDGTSWKSRPDCIWSEKIQQAAPASPYNQQAYNQQSYYNYQNNGDVYQPAVGSPEQNMPAANKKPKPPVKPKKSPFIPILVSITSIVVVFAVVATVWMIKDKDKDSSDNKTKDKEKTTASETIKSEEKTTVKETTTEKSEIINVKNESDAEEFFNEFILMFYEWNDIVYMLDKVEGQAPVKTEGEVSYYLISGPGIHSLDDLRNKFLTYCSKDVYDGLFDEYWFKDINGKLTIGSEYCEPASSSYVIKSTTKVSDSEYRIVTDSTILTAGPYSTFTTTWTLKKENSKWLVTAMEMGTRTYVDWLDKEYKVNTQSSDLNMRAFPNAKAEVILTLKKGTVVGVYRTCGDWYNISYSVNDKYYDGWVKAEYLTPA